MDFFWSKKGARVRVFHVNTLPKSVFRLFDKWGYRHKKKGKIIERDKSEKKNKKKKKKYPHTHIYTVRSVYVYNFALFLCDRIKK